MYGDATGIGLIHGGMLVTEALQPPKPLLTHPQRDNVGDWQLSVA
jgi:hypothetical protein